MNDLFKTILKDFHNSLPVRDVKPRDLQVPLRSGKNHIPNRSTAKWEDFPFFHVV